MAFEPREKPRRYILIWPTALAGAVLMIWTAINHFMSMD